MNCAISVLKRLELKYHFEVHEVIEKCQIQLTPQGLNFFTLYTSLKEAGFSVHAVNSLSMELPCPYIAFYQFKNSGHYVLVESINDVVQLYDPQFGEITCSKWRFYLKWSKTALFFTLK